MKVVFVGGVDRSGTTMLGVELSRVSNVFCLPEAQFLARLLRRYGNDLVCSEKIKPLLLAEKSFRNFWMNRVDVSLLNGEKTIADWYLELAHMYLDAERNIGVLVDQTPANLRNALILRKYFSCSKFVHIIRDGRAVSNSIVPLDWGPKNVHDAACYWAKNISYGLALEKFLGDKCCSVFYEVFVQDPEASLKELCRTIEVEAKIEDEVRGINVPVNDYNKKQHAHVGKGIVQESAHKWKKQLATRDIEIIEAEVGGLLAIMGYELMYVDPRRITLREHILGKVKFYFFDYVPVLFRRWARTGFRLGNL